MKENIKTTQPADFQPYIAKLEGTTPPKGRIWGKGSRRVLLKRYSQDRLKIAKLKGILRKTTLTDLVARVIFPIQILLISAGRYTIATFWSIWLKIYRLPNPLLTIFALTESLSRDQLLQKVYSYTTDNFRWCLVEIFFFFTLQIQGTCPFHHILPAKFFGPFHHFHNAHNTPCLLPST